MADTRFSPPPGKDYSCVDPSPRWVPTRMPDGRIVESRIVTLDEAEADLASAMRQLRAFLRNRD